MRGRGQEDSVMLENELGLTDGERTRLRQVGGRRGAAADPTAPKLGSVAGSERCSGGARWGPPVGPRPAKGRFPAPMPGASPAPRRNRGDARGRPSWRSAPGREGRPGAQPMGALRLLS